MKNYADTLDHNARHRSQKAPELDHLRIHEGEDGGHIVEHHFESGPGPFQEAEHYPFEEHDGPKPKLPEGHVLHHIAKHMNIDHEVMAAEKSVEENKGHAESEAKSEAE